MTRAAAIALFVIVAMSCLVDRRSSDFACDDDADCTEYEDNRLCSNGYCVPDCPDICDDCDPGRICEITCGTNDCDNEGVACPAGWNCRIRCTDDCTPVDCASAASCTVTCQSNTTCGPLMCGAATSPCTCTASGSAVCQ